MKNIKINKKSVIICSLIIVLIIISIFVFYFYKNKMSYYESKIIEYGLDKKYNNQTANENENVTKSEAVKMIIESIILGTDISEYASVYTKEDFPNITWVIYGNDTNTIKYEDYNEEKQSQNITCIEAFRIIYNSKNRIFIPKEGINKVVDETDIVIKNENEFTDEEKDIIKDLIFYGILDNKYSYSKDKLLTKKIFNKVLVKFIETYRFNERI